MSPRKKALEQQASPPTRHGATIGVKSRFSHSFGYPRGAAHFGHANVGTRCRNLRTSVESRDHELIPKTHSYRITAKGLQTAIFYTRLYNRSLRTGLALISPDAANANLPLTRSIRAAETALNTWYDKDNLAA